MLINGLVKFYITPIMNKGHWEEQRPRRKEENFGSYSQKICNLIIEMKWTNMSQI